MAGRGRASSPFPSASGLCDGSMPLERGSTDLGSISTDGTRPGQLTKGPMWVFIRGACAFGKPSDRRWGHWARGMACAPSSGCDGRNPDEVAGCGLAVGQGRGCVAVCRLWSFFGPCCSLSLMLRRAIDGRPSGRGCDPIVELRRGALDKRQLVDDRYPSEPKPRDTCITADLLDVGADGCFFHSCVSGPSPLPVCQAGNPDERDMRQGQPWSGVCL